MEAMPTDVIKEKLQALMTRRALEAEADIRAGRVYTLEEAEARINNFLASRQSPDQMKA